jgi:hypothetical protein
MIADSQLNFAKLEGIPTGATDAHTAWGVATNYTDYGGPKKSYLLAYEIDYSLLSNKIIDFAQHVLEIFPVGAALHPVWWNAQSIFGTATVEAKLIPLIRKLVESGFITRFELALLPTGERLPSATPPALDAGQKPCVTCNAELMYGVVDYGCPLAHARMRTASGASRLLNVWYQGATPKIPNAGAPQRWGFGSAVDHADLNPVLSSAAADEAVKFAELGLPELSRDLSHGAQLLGYVLDAPESPSIKYFGYSDHLPSKPRAKLPDAPDLVFVQLPPGYEQGMPRCAFPAYRLAALRYILECAGANTKRIVVPIASENTDGSHDGTSLFEVAVDALIEFAKANRAKDFRVIFGAGNSFAADTHTKIEIAPKSREQSLALRVLPGSERVTFAEIWLPKNLLNTEFALTPPGAATGSEVWCNGDGIWTAGPNGQVTAGIISVSYAQQRCVLFRISPTLVYSGQAAPVGDWTISLRAANDQADSDTAYGYVANGVHGIGGRMRGHSSYWVRPRPIVGTLDETLQFVEEFNLGAGSVSGLANGKDVTVVGGYRLADQKRAQYSAAGPSRKPGRLLGTRVDASVPTDESASLPGIRGWNNRSAGSARMSGNSVAAGLTAWLVGNRSLSPPPPPSNPMLDPQVPVTAFR